MEIISPADRTRMEQQLKELYAQRPIISTRIAEARANGDLKENADYHAAREEQGLVEAKIRELELRLRTAQVAGDTAIPKDMVFLGAVVRLKDVATGKSQTYKLVGNMTDDDDGDHIEVTSSSPLGVALMKARLGETVRADLPRGEKRFEIVEILE
ncbi:MAG: Transcription elongation factor GreA [Planctomycetota bacterium]|jgi:transcription elongation factor GreA